MRDCNVSRNRIGWKLVWKLEIREDKSERFEGRKINWNSLKRGKEIDLSDIEVRDNINISVGILNFKSCQLYWTINISMWKIFYAYKMKFLNGIIYPFLEANIEGKIQRFFSKNKKIINIII